MKNDKKSLMKNKHIRWDFGPSPDAEGMLRYLVVISGERFDRESNLEILTEQLSFYGGSIIPVRESEGKTKDTNFRYKLSIFDSRTNPNMINWNEFSLKRSKDKRLYERIKRGFSVEDYVANLYER